MNQRTRKEAHQPKNRPARVPVSGGTDVLKAYGISTEDEANYHYHAVLDKDGLVEKYQRGGYEIVQDPGVTLGESARQSGDKVQTIGNRSTGEMQILMRIPMEYYLEDRRNQELNLRNEEKAIYSPNEDDEHGQYGEVETKIER